MEDSENTFYLGGDILPNETIEDYIDRLLWEHNEILERKDS